LEGCAGFQQFNLEGASRIAGQAPFDGLSAFGFQASPPLGETRERLGGVER